MPGHEHRGGGQATKGRLPCMDAFRGGGWTWVRAAGQGLGDAEVPPTSSRAASRDTPASALQEGP